MKKYILPTMTFFLLQSSPALASDPTFVDNADDMVELMTDFLDW